MKNITPITKGNIKAITAEVKAQGFKCSRPDGLRISINALIVRDGFNYRAIDTEHVEQLKTAFSNGVAPSAFKVQPVETEEGKRFAIIGGHHTHLALKSLIESDNPNFNEDTLFDAEAVFPKNEADAQLMAFNHNQGKSSSVIENARLFALLQREGMALADIANRTGMAKSVICNSVKLLEGDAQLIELVESKKISATKARNFINQHGAEEATKYALAHITMKNKPTAQIAENNEAESTTGGEDNTETTTPNTDRVAAKSHKTNTGLQMRSLSTGKAKELETLITQMASRVSEDGTISLPPVLLEKLHTLASDIKEVDDHNTSVLEQMSALATK